jgi:hypothetical protein
MELSFVNVQGTNDIMKHDHIHGTVQMAYRDEVLDTCIFTLHNRHKLELGVRPDQC